MITFKKIVDDFKTLTDNHYQLNSFGSGDLTQLIYHTSQVDGKDNEDNSSPIYPLLYLVPSSVNRGEQSITYSFDIVIVDIDSSKKEPELQTELWSDTLQITEDVLAQFKYSVTATQGDYEEKYDIVLPVTCQPFSERFDDLLVGWTTTLQIVVDSPLNRCIAPYKSFN